MCDVNDVNDMNDKRPTVRCTDREVLCSGVSFYLVLCVCRDECMDTAWSQRLMITLEVCVCDQFVLLELVSRLWTHHGVGKGKISLRTLLHTLALTHTHTLFLRYLIHLLNKYWKPSCGFYNVVKAPTVQSWLTLCSYTQVQEWEFVYILFN